MSAYVVSWSAGIESLADLGGIGWAAAPMPPRRHPCQAQTIGFISGNQVQRCACGAISRNNRQWMERNTRRGPVGPLWRRLLGGRR